MTFHPRPFVIPIFIGVCLLLGGASAAGYSANMLLQLTAIAIIAWSLVAERSAPLPRVASQLLVLTVAMLGLMAVQLIPLPPGLWTALPGREEAAAGFQLLGEPLPWLSISLTPDRTVAAALWLLPALAVLLAMIRAGAYKPEFLAGVILAVTLVAIAIGAVQRAGNEAAYFYQITNRGLGTGFFANANHMATLLMCAIPFLSAFYLVARSRSRSAQRSSALLVILAGTLGVLVVGLIINGSRAGLGLAVPVLIASGLMLLSRKRRIPAWTLLPVLVLSLVGIASVFFAPVGNDFTQQVQDVSISRSTFFPNTIRAALDFLPLGSGVGSFTSVYPLYENPAIITSTYANHAHSDFLELWLETGVPGMLLLVVFLLWWARRAIAIWRSEEVDQFARAATIASGAIIGHSLVDYPLRTAAVSAIFAACCALMAESRPWVRPRRTSGQTEARHLSAG
jgi:O-antigen ligase